MPQRHETAMQTTCPNGLGKHPDRKRLEAFGLGRLAPEDYAQVETHLADCASCWEVVEEVLPVDPVVQVICSLPPERRRFAESAGSAVEPLHLAPAIPAPPTELAGHSRYQMIEFIGQGGMGQVWKARHLLMNRLVAIKVISLALLQSSTAVARFRREVEAAARLDHPNIVRAYDAEQVGGLHFLVMEFVEGIDLARLVRDRGPLPVAEACGCCRQVALGLQHAHERGMVHRDIKPQNLVQTSSGQVKILDFGLASFLAEREADGLGEPLQVALSTGSNPSLTRVGDSCGTPDYISPEQVRNARAVDIRADIYSLGCTLYYLLAGKPPFAGGSGYSKVAGHLERAPTPLSEARSDLPPALLEVVSQMLAKNPKRRFQTPAEVADALAPFAAGESGRFGRQRMTRRRWMMAATTAGVGLLGGWFLWRKASVPRAKEVLRMEGHTAAIQNVALSPDGRLALSGGEDRTMRLWSLDTGQERHCFQGHAHTVSRVVFLPDSQHAITASHDHTLRLWHLETNEELRRYEGSNERVIFVAVSPDGQQMLSSSSGTVLLHWSIETGRILHRFATPSGAGFLRFLTNEQGVSGGSDRYVRFWNLQTGQQTGQLGEHSHGVEVLGIAADQSQVLVGCADKTAWLWDLTSGQELQRLSLPHRVYRVVSTPAGFWVACNDDQGSISVWDVNTQQELFRIGGHEAVVWGLEFSADRRFALTGSKDKTVRWWELPSPMPA